MFKFMRFGRKSAAPKAVVSQGSSFFSNFRNGDLMMVEWANKDKLVGPAVCGKSKFVGIYLNGNQNDYSRCVTIFDGTGEATHGVVKVSLIRNNKEINSWTNS